MTKNKPETFYIKNNLLLSSKSTTIQIPQTIPEIKITEKDNTQQTNKQIITQLKKIFQTKPKKITIYGEIKNFEKIKNEILKNKNLLQKPKEHNYDFIAKTSQIEILNQILKTNPKDSLNHLKIKIIKHTQKNEKQENKLTKEIQKNLQTEKKELNKIQDLNQKLTEKLSSLQNKTEKEEKNLKKLETQTEKLNLIINPPQTSKLQKQKKIKTKIELIRCKIQNLEYNKKILNAKCATLRAIKKSGTKKHPSIILLILTLGLIYWTKYSNINYQINKTQTKIRKIEEKQIKLEKKINQKQIQLNKIQKIPQTQTKKEQAKKELSKLLKEQTQKEEALINLKNEQETLENKLKKTQTQEKELLEKTNQTENKLKQIQKHSPKKILSKIDTLNNQIEEQTKTIQNLKQKLLSQKINIDGEWTIKFPIRK